MQRYVIVLLLVLMVLVVIVYQQKDQITYILTGKKPIDTGGISTGKMQLTSPAFSQNENVPKLYTCEGSDLNPPLTISGTPSNAKSLAIVIDDPDANYPGAPDGAWVHWVTWNIPANTKNIAQGTPVGTQGANSGGESKYMGPCPPEGPAHMYIFKIYALDTTLTLNAGATKQQLEQAMQGHILDSTVLTGLYAAGSGPTPPTPPPMPPVGPTPPSNVTQPPTPDVKKLEISPNTLMIFYFTSVGSGTKSLPSVVSTTEGTPSTKVIYITAQPITWSSTYYAIIGDIPSLDKAYVIDKTISYSYSRSVLRVRTNGNRVIVLNERGERNPLIYDFKVIDQITGGTIKNVDLYPRSSVGSFAIIGDSFYYHASDGLYKRDFSATQSTKLLDDNDPSNKGKLYSVGNRLFSVDGTYEASTKLTTNIIREHSTSTGKIIKEVTSFPTSISSLATFYDGETALYFSLKDTSANAYEIYRVTSGEPEYMFEVVLNAGETGLGKVDETNGYLIVPILSSSTNTLVVYNLKKNKGEDDIIIKKDELIGPGFTLASAEYSMLNPQ